MKPDIVLPDDGEIYHALFESMSDGYLLGKLVRGRDGRPADFAIREANAAFEKLTGIRRDLLAGRKISEIVPADEDSWLRHISEIAGNGGPARFEEYSPSIGKWLDIYVYSLHRGDLYAVIISDATKRVRTDEALRKNETFLNNIFDSIQDGISVLDGDLNIVRTNHVMEEWYRHMLPLAGKKCYHAYHCRSQPCDICPSRMAILRKTMQSGIVPFHRENGREEGWLEIYSFPMLDAGGNVTGVIEHVRDITRRKAAEEALRSSEARFRTLFENASVAIVIVDSGTGIVRDCNSNAERLFGLSRAELTGISVLRLHPPENTEEHRRNIMRQAEQGHIVNYEADVLHKDGRKIPVIINATPVEVGGENIMLGFFLDITDRKRAEKESLEARAQAELYLDLMGHDINNIHQVALGYLEVARDTTADERQKALLARPIEALQRSARLIQNVQKLQQLREGTINAQAIDLCTLLADLVREYGAMPGSTIALDLNGHKSCYVMANELLYDVFANLVGNAIRHANGQARISVGLERRTEEHGTYYAVSVEDDGPGIPDDLKDAVFRRRLKGTTRAKGSGIGLYLVRSLVDSYRGIVWAEDRVPGDHSQGARFVVMLPVA